MVINRFLDPTNFKRMKDNFKFLLKIIKDKDYIGEFDLALRDNYFNIYYQGNSLAKVDFGKEDAYKIKINDKFFSNTSAQNDKRFHAVKKNDYFEIVLDKRLLHPFFQKKYIDEFISNIRQVNYSEELVREQAIITDNLGRENFVIIDRQIRDKNFKRRMDLLALKQVDKDTYRFLVIEVKLGNNPELKDEVAKQLDKYVSHIDQNFDDYKDCYEKQYEQKRGLGLIIGPKYESIKIVKPVRGLIVVVGYSGIAKGQIAQLTSIPLGLKIKSFSYLL